VFATFSEVVGYRLTNYTVPELRRPQSTFSLTSSQMSYHTDINVNNCRLHTCVLVLWMSGVGSYMQT
jgi:hypothetical protein